MSELVWDTIGEREYETGVDRVVIFPMSGNTYGVGEAWSGVTQIQENPSGAEPNKIYADNIKYLELMSAEELGLSINAYMYPDAVKECDGSVFAATGVSIGQQSRKPFGLAYRTILGNDTTENDYGYKLHLVYNCKMSPSEKGYSTVNDDPEAIEFSWEVSTTPVVLTSKDANDKVYKPTAIITIDSTKANETKLKAFEAILYGTNPTTGDNPTPGTDPTLMDPDSVIAYFNAT